VNGNYTQDPDLIPNITGKNKAYLQFYYINYFRNQRLVQPN